MPPQALHPYARKATSTKAIPPDPQEIAHLAVLAADTIEALPPALTRSLSDLKELDAVLNTALQQITTKLGTLLELIDDANATPAQRLALLKEVADEAAGFKLGGEDKIRVATGTCESILHHSKQLDLITSLMTSLMPQHVLELIPASSTPSGYPHLFPSYGSATAASLYRPRTDFFPPPLPLGLAGGVATGITRAAQAQYNQALSTVQRYQQEGPLPNMQGSGRSRPQQAVKKPPPPVQAPRARTISQSSHIGGTLPPPELSHHQPESPPIDSAAAKAKRRPPPAPVTTVWDVPPGAEGDEGSNVGSPASTAANGNGRGSKRPRSSQAPPSAGGTTGGNSPVGEKPPLAGAARRRQIKKTSPDPRSSGNGSRERSAPSNGRGRRGAANDTDLDDAPMTGEEMPIDAAEAVEPAIEGEVAGEVPAPNSTGSTIPDSREGEQLYCTCRRVSYGEMIGCDAEDCKIEWFHLACVGLTDPPRGRWICPDCSKEERNASKKRRIA